MIEEVEKHNLVDFFMACNEMIDGRFILSDTKVSNVLKAIVKSETLYKLYGDCMKGFKFSEVLSSSLASNNGGYFVMPESSQDILAFVTCLLLEVDKKNIGLQAFVTDNFYSTEGYNISYSNFALTVLTGYKEAVKSLLGVDENGDSVYDNVDIQEDVEEVKPDDNTKILFANLLLAITDLQEAINNESKIKYAEKQELMIVLKGLNRAVHLQELILINSLLIPLEYKIGKNKKLKQPYEKLKMLIADIYF